MIKEEYLAPVVEVIEVMVEKGFVQSPVIPGGASGTVDGWGDGN